MNKVTISLLICLLFTIGTTFGQVRNACDSIYTELDQSPEFQNGIKGLLDYLNTDLIPIISRNMKEDKVIVDKLYANVIINRDGNVVDVEFLKLNGSEKCKEELKKKIMTMTGWTPGKMNGQSVCSNYFWVVGCIKWE